MGKTNYLTSLSSKGCSCEILVDKDVGYKTIKVSSSFLVISSKSSEKL